MYTKTRQYLEENLEKSVKIIGKVSNIRWQHIEIYIETHPNVNFIDLENDFQLIVYTDKKIDCKNKVEVIGKVTKVKGNEHPKSKLSDEYFEYHIVADSWRCI